MINNIFRTVRELLENRDCVLMGNAVNTEGKLYDDSVENLHALDMLEPSCAALWTYAWQAAWNVPNCMKSSACLAWRANNMTHDRTYFRMLSDTALAEAARYCDNDLAIVLGERLESTLNVEEKLEALQILYDRLVAENNALRDDMAA
jgi:hypothetical protein